MEGGGGEGEVEPEGSGPVDSRDQSTESTEQGTGHFLLRSRRKEVADPVIAVRCVAGRSLGKFLSDSV